MFLYIHMHAVACIYLIIIIVVNDNRNFEKWSDLINCHVYNHDKIVKLYNCSTLLSFLAGFIVHAQKHDAEFYDLSPVVATGSNVIQPFIQALLSDRCCLFESGDSNKQHTAMDSLFCSRRFITDSVDSVAHKKAMQSLLVFSTLCSCLRRFI